MPAVTDSQLQALIRSELNVANLPGLVAKFRTDYVSEFDANMPIWWALFDEKRRIAPRLQFLYVYRHAIDFLIGKIQQITDWSAASGSSRKAGQHVEHLLKMREPIQQEVVIIEKRALAGRLPAYGAIAATAPLPFVPGTAYVPVLGDPNDSLYQGDPRKRPLVRLP